MKKELVFTVAFSLAAIFPAVSVSQAVDVRGVVVDVNNAPVAGVVLSLRVRGLTDTTKPDGSFHLKTVNAASPAARGPNGIVPEIRGNALWIPRGNGPGKTTVDAFDLSGKLLGSISLGLSRGIKSAVPLEKLAGPARKISLLRVKIDGCTCLLRYIPGLSQGQAMSSGKALSASKRNSEGLALDTLRIQKSAFLTKRMALDTLIGTLDTIRIYGSDIELTTANYPRLDGSSLTQPLSSITACRLLNCSFGWYTSFDGSKKIVAYSSSNPAKADSINTKIALHYGTHDAYVKIINGSADLALMNRLPSADELALAQKGGVSLDVQTVARDAFIFIVNEKNHVPGLTVQTIRNIYTGKITNWQDVGWINATLRPYQRDSASASQELMMLLVMKELTPIKAPNMILLGMMGPIDMLSQDTLGLCYSVYFFKEFMSVSEKIVPVPIEGVAPTYDNIFDRRYPLTVDIALVTRKNQGPSSNACRLREYLMSEEGQAVVKECGYVPLFNP
jgi:phosphate transport system substrate-binding protein